jgi:hypothetical protein
MEITGSGFSRSTLALRGPCCVFPSEAKALLALVKMHGYDPAVSPDWLRMKLRYFVHYGEDKEGTPKYGPITHDLSRAQFDSDEECFEYMAQAVRELQALQDPEANARIVVSFIPRQDHSPPPSPPPRARSRSRERD